MAKLQPSAPPRGFPRLAMLEAAQIVAPASAVADGGGDPEGFVGMHLWQVVLAATWFCIKFVCLTLRVCCLLFRSFFFKADPRKLQQKKERSVAKEALARKRFTEQLEDQHRAREERLAMKVFKVDL